jgi:hypothetical protein
VKAKRASIETMIVNFLFILLTSVSPVPGKV